MNIPSQIAIEEDWSLSAMEKDENKLKTAADVKKYCQELKDSHLKRHNDQIQSAINNVLCQIKEACDQNSGKTNFAVVAIDTSHNDMVIQHLRNLGFEVQPTTVPCNYNIIWSY